MKGFAFSFCIIAMIAILVGCSASRRTSDVTYVDGAMHTIQPGETLAQIARAYNVTPQLLRRVNNIEDPSRIPAGTRIFIPGANELRNAAADQAMENLADARPTPFMPPPGKDGLYHTVQPGETLISIARAYDVPMQTLQRVNVIANASHIQSGQRLWIPGGTEVLDIEVQDPVIVASQPLPEIPATTIITTTQSTNPSTNSSNNNTIASANTNNTSGNNTSNTSNTSNNTTPTTETTTTTTRTQISNDTPRVTVKIDPLPTPTPTPKPDSSEREQEFPRAVEEFGDERFQWPIKDSFRVLLGFSNTPGQKNTGLDLGAPIGTAVYSAANGVVDEVGKPTDDLGTSLGNYVIIHHGKRNNKNIFSIYAHLESTTVQKGQNVNRGQQIGTIGRTGRPAVGDSGVLHFEIRESYVAIDPRGVLPKLN